MKQRKAATTKRIKLRLPEDIFNRDGADACVATVRSHRLRRRHAWLKTFMTLLMIVLLGDRGQATIRTWVGDADSDWFRPGNWEPVGVPASGDHVVVGPAPNDVVLTNATARMGSFTIENQTLTMHQWQTRIEADMLRVLNGGAITLPGPFMQGDPSNRVWLVCNDFLLADGGVIDAAGLGYAPQQGPGAASGTSRGGGYGGRGIAGGWTGVVGPAYGNAESPGAPGSGGANGEGGFPGGGAVRIEASGDLRVDGLICADGVSGRGSGSGGAIWLSAETISGSNGVLWARGGAGGGRLDGTGGGGRIALHFAQVGVWHGMQISARHGHGGSPSLFQLTHAGSVFSAQASLLNDQKAGALLANIEGRIYFGDGQEWITDAVVVEAGFLGFASNLQVMVNGPVTLARDAVVSFEGDNQMTSIGDFHLQEGARLHVRGGPTNALDKRYGARIDIHGLLHIENDAWIYPLSDPWNGGSVRITARRAVIEYGGGIDASQRGFAGMQGPGVSSGSAGGAGYGGQGGTGGWSASAGQPYGNSYAPIDAGSGSGAGAGGGVIRLDVADRLTLQGQLLAEGCEQAGNSGASSGGAIWITAGRVRSSETARISANGGLSSGNLAGGGGGGRIAVWQPSPPPVFFDKVRDGYLPAVADYSLAPPGWYGVAVADGGVNSANENRNGEDGTVFFCRVPGGSVLLVR